MDLSQILDVARTVIIGLGAVFAVLQLREIARDRKTELVIKLCSQYLSELTEPYCKLFSEEFADPAEMEKKISYERLFKLAAFYEAVGHFGIARRPNFLRTGSISSISPI